MEPSESSSSSNNYEVEAVDLLEECWFFNNLFKETSTRMLRSNSDPCTSSKFSQEMLLRSSSDNNDQSSSNSSTKELSVSGEQQQCVVHHHKLIRAPSLPPCIGRKQENVQEQKSNINNGGCKLIRQSSLQAPKPSCAGKKEGSTQVLKGSIATKNKLSEQSSRRSLLRTTTLPPDIGRQDIDHDKESDARMSILIQQAFANSSDIFHSQQQTSKGMTQSYSIPRFRPPRSSEVESNNTNGIKEMNRRYGLNQGKIRKTLSDLESEEVQGFKDLGFTFDKDDLSPSVVNILPGLQEKDPEDLSQLDNKMRRPYLSEAWIVQNCGPAPPPVPNWVARNSAEDLKAQIKFWARAVASNVRVQEC